MLESVCLTANLYCLFITPVFFKFGMHANGLGVLPHTADHELQIQSWIHDHGARPRSLQINMHPHDFVLLQQPSEKYCIAWAVCFYLIYSKGSGGRDLLLASLLS